MRSLLEESPLCTGGRRAACAHTRIPTPYQHYPARRVPKFGWHLGGGGAPCIQVAPGAHLECALGRRPTSGRPRGGSTSGQRPKVAPSDPGTAPHLDVVSSPHSWRAKRAGTAHLGTPRKVEPDTQTPPHPLPGWTPQGASVHIWIAPRGSAAPHLDAFPPPRTPSLQQHPQPGPTAGCPSKVSPPYLGILPKQHPTSGHPLTSVHPPTHTHTRLLVPKPCAPAGFFSAPDLSGDLPTLIYPYLGKKCFFPPGKMLSR